MSRGVNSVPEGLQSRVHFLLSSLPAFLILVLRNAHALLVREGCDRSDLQFSFWVPAKGGTGLRRPYTVAGVVSFAAGWPGPVAG
jgi:hypothetical protein